MYRFNHPSLANTRRDQKPEQSRSISWTKALAVSALPLAFLFGAAFQSPNSVPGQLQAIQSQINELQAQFASLANKGPRKFYLTQTTHTGAQALSACAQGYHMASLREIFDTSNLRYDRDLGHTLADSGFGPPNFFGWIRTGGPASGDNIAGRGNCDVWSSASVSDLGTVVGVHGVWLNPAGNLPISPWTSNVFSCDGPTRVWCVQD